MSKHHRPGARRIFSERADYPFAVQRSSELGCDYWPAVTWYHDGPKDISSVQAVHRAGNTCVIVLAEHRPTGHLFMLAAPPEAPYWLGIAPTCAPGTALLERAGLPLPTSWANRQQWLLLARQGWKDTPRAPSRN